MIDKAQPQARKLLTISEAADRLNCSPTSLYAQIKDGDLRLGTLKTIANSIQLSLRPMDMVARYDLNTFAVSIQYQDPALFNPELFERLIQNIRRHALQTTEQGKQLRIAVGVWHGQDLEPTPTVEEIISFAKQSSVLID